MTAHISRRVIQHNTTTSLMNGVVRWLKTEPSSNDAEWQAHTELIQACLEEMVEMSVNRRPIADKLDRAMPHVRSMLVGMWEHDRLTALAHGEITLQQLLPRHPASSCFRSRKNHHYGNTIPVREVVRPMSHASAN